ncbi:MAG TPA: diaminopimelate epimerase [Bacteroidia bacterium]|nr:diaminopimelate epimerase [Bacteroidia bacterium]
MSKVIFSKFHGTGNDFILIDNREQKLVFDNPEVVSLMCDRRFGIGADGLIMLEESGSFDFRMVYFNADGYPGSMCGNGGRCITAFASRLGLVQGEAAFEASDGLHEAFILSKADSQWNVSLRMNDVTRVEMLDDAYILDTGSPHYVTLADHLESLEVEKQGRIIRNQPRFKEKGINVNFISFLPEGTAIRTYERGVENETFSCGTGSVAAAIVTELKGKKHPAGPVSILTRGGNLKVKFKTDGDEYTDIWLEGPAVFVFEGAYNIPGK